MKNIRMFYLKIFIFLVVNVSVYLDRHVFVMNYPCLEQTSMVFEPLKTEVRPYLLI